LQMQNMPEEMIAYEESVLPQLKKAQWRKM
jgi:hypothetical protein